MALKLRNIFHPLIQTKTLRAGIGLTAVALFYGVTPGVIAKRNRPEAATVILTRKDIKNPKPKAEPLMNTVKGVTARKPETPLSIEEDEERKMLERIITKPPEKLADQKQVFQNGYSPKIGAIFLSLNSDGMGLTGVRVLEVTKTSIKIEYLVSAYTQNDDMFGTLSYKSASELFMEKALDQVIVSLGRPLNINAFGSSIHFFVGSLSGSDPRLIIKFDGLRDALFIEKTVEEKKDY